MQEVEEMVKEIDTTGEGEIAFSDFVRVVSKKIDGKKYKRNELMQAFKKFENGAPSGFIQEEDLIKLLMKSSNITLEGAQAMTAQMEPDFDTRLINYSRYVELMLS